MTTEVDDFLAHYGVKGMRWGVVKKSADSGPKQPSRRQVRIEAKYLRDGFDPDIAAKKARGKIAVQNILLATGATVLAAGAGYAAYQAADRRFGGVNLPMGTKVHHVNVHGPSLLVQDKPMFVAFNKRDQKFYDSVFANFAKNRAGAENIYKSTLEATTDIKAPSNFQAAKLYREFAKAKGIKTSYSDFNYAFNGEAGGVPGHTKKEFVKFMRGKGYNAMVDNFDTMKSLRSRTNRPTILFDPTSSIKKIDDILLDNGKVTMTAAKYELSNLATKAAFSPKSTAFTLMVGLGAFSSSRNAERPREIKVDAYKKEHPGTDLTDAQIYNLVSFKA